MIPDANIGTLFAQFAYQASPTGDIAFFGLVIIMIFVWLFWGLGISQVSALMLSFLLIGALHLMIGGIFTTLFLLFAAIIGMLFVANLFVRIARFG